MNRNDYYSARDHVVEILRKDFLGPVTEDEILTEFPLDYYILGKLYPQESDSTIIGGFSSEDCGDLEDEDVISLCNGSNPSSCGITFLINPSVDGFDVTVKAAHYENISREAAKAVLKFDDKEYKESTRFWRRVPVSKEISCIKVETLSEKRILTFDISDNLVLKVYLHKTYEDNSKTITASLINNNTRKTDLLELNRAAYLQPHIEVKSSVPSAFGDVRKNIRMSKDAEAAELEMLYSSVNSFASGHGCAVSRDERNGNCNKIWTEFFPAYELMQMMPSQEFKGQILSMKYLSEASGKAIANGIEQLLSTYDAWISGLRKRTDKIILYGESAETNIKKCTDTLNRLRKSLACIMSDSNVLRAFQLANKAMFMQRKQTLCNRGKYTTDDDIRWYPFQLAFFLQEIISIADPDSKERKQVDLLWFPTGGGKTEAYLGIAAFTIFLRRLRGGMYGDGVTVLMRYTLRLLSFQQFERAAALVCACEIIRKEEHVPGGEIGIGLWAGKALTPNKLEMAKKILDGGSDPDSEGSNPAQITKCPWCGADILKGHYDVQEKQKRMLIKCPGRKCAFRDGLPIYLIDEEIYAHRPTYMIATVDKFAQVALNEETSSIFGLDTGRKPPELIIQDELHLISGPLGTITGLYEAAITKLCEYNGRKPKIIASTATIKNAKEQINALYAADYTQFPPQGLDITDSFFAVESTREQRPSRLYLGCMAVGTSAMTMFIRVMACLIYATRYLIELDFSDEVIDSFWTLTGYFNSLRELGGAIIRVEDDIQDRFAYLRTKKLRGLYPLSSRCQNRYDRYKELTSREKSEEIGKIIQNELPKKYTSDGSEAPYDVLLASNMISVGVDVGRLGTMVVVGQPKTTSEYIQATSRVGRENPGLVIATYNQAKSRDRSHYEQFHQYHSSFYKFVEATSVTPFADRARDRALQTLYVILCRYTIPSLRKDTDAINFRRDLEGLDWVRNYIFDYVSVVDPEELENVKREIEEIEEVWADKTYRRDKLRYRNSKYTRKEDSLFDDDYDEKSRFRVLNTMRSVETTVNVIVKE